MFTRRCCCTLFVAGSMAAATVGQNLGGQPAGPEFVGEVIAANVNVRSGPGTNYYEVTRLNAGERVTVYGEETGWYAIAPPQGCFSLIHKKFVDLDASGVEGVVNGDAVFVRAGSELKPDLYAKQLKLNRGATVQVIKPHNDDYLRIVPPAEARVYINRRYVQQVPESRLAVDSAPAAASFTGARSTDSEAADARRPADETDESAAADREKPPLQPGKFRDQIAALDAAVDAETQKPFLRRAYEPLIERFRPLAQQRIDPYARVYAKARIAQLEEASESVGDVRHLRDLAEQITTDRKNALMQRNQMRAPAREIGGGFDAVGELRPSVLFGHSVGGPRWYRLVADDVSPLRNIGYVEIPQDSSIDVSAYLWL